MPWDWGDFSGYMGIGIGFATRTLVRRIPLVGGVLGGPGYIAGVGGAAYAGGEIFGEGTDPLHALSQGASIGLIGTLGGKIGGAAAHAAEPHLVRALETAHAAGKLGPVGLRIGETLSVDMMRGRAGARLAGTAVPIYGTEGFVDAVYDISNSDSAAGRWIGGDGDGLTARIPESDGTGFLFQPDRMPEPIRTQYADLADVLNRAWRCFGSPGSEDSTPQHTPPGAIAAAQSFSGQGAHMYGTHTTNLHEHLDTAPHYETAIHEAVAAVDSHLDQAIRHQSTAADGIDSTATELTTARTT